MNVAIERFETRGPAGRLVGLTGQPSAEPAGLPVLFIHGINMSSDVWSEVLERLVASRRVVALDLRGHGGSDLLGPFTAEDYADDAIAVLDAMGIEAAHVVGVSYGASVGCALAVKSPRRIRSITAIGGALTVEGLDVDAAMAALRAVGARDFFAGFLPQASFAPGTDPAIIERALGVAVNGRDVATIIDVSTTAITADSTAIADEVRCPALVMTGELDMTCPLPLGEAMAKALGTELVVLPGRGHVAPMEDPDTVAAMVAEHVARQLK
ncbi:MAG: alpha/beta fold hydrolase [Acidimicrobiales bacterium]